jgi:hypothetical protein
VPDRVTKALSEDRISAEKAGYMEFPGAIKDADCKHIFVPGGVSSEGGCCNEFAWDGTEKEFECGTCTFLVGEHHEEHELK